MPARAGRWQRRTDLRGGQPHRRGPQTTRPERHRGAGWMYPSEAQCPVGRRRGQRGGQRFAKRTMPATPAASVPTIPTHRRSHTRGIGTRPVTRPRRATRAMRSTTRRGVATPLISAIDPRGPSRVFRVCSLMPYSPEELDDRSGRTGSVAAPEERDVGSAVPDEPWVTTTAWTWFTAVPWGDHHGWTVARVREFGKALRLPDMNLRRTSDGDVGGAHIGVGWRRALTEPTVAGSLRFARRLRRRLLALFVPAPREQRSSRFVRCPDHRATPWRSASSATTSPTGTWRAAALARMSATAASRQ